MTEQTVERPLFGTRLLRAPQIVRIFVAAIFAFAVALLSDRLFIPTIDPQTGSSTFSVSIVVGVIAYVIGWWVLIGFKDGKPPPRRILPFYLIIGSILLLIAVGVILVSLMMTLSGI